jgi:hypothetical protein
MSKGLHRGSLALVGVHLPLLRMRARAEERAKSFALTHCALDPPEGAINIRGCANGRLPILGVKRRSTG